MVPIKILMIDIETSPSLAHVWSLWDQRIGINQLVDVTEMLCFAAKWYGEKNVWFYSIHEHGKESMVTQAWDMLNEADVVMGYNSRSFDVKHLNREFLLAGYPPPSPYKQIDLYTAVKKQFRFISNKLGYVAEALGLGGKVKHEGFDLWLKCMAGDAAAWKRMEKYNIQDVKLLETLYNQIQPWIPNHPNINLYKEEDTPDGCPSCGSTNYTKDGSTMTNAGRFPKFRCSACHKHFRSSKREAGTEFQGIAS